jgi:hypothetical protein
MKLDLMQHSRMPEKNFLPWIFSLALLAAFSLSAWAQQPVAASHSAATDAAQKDFIEEWVYRVQYGHKDEWFRIFRKYQLAILERQKQLGFVKEYTVWAPGLHASEESRWDYRVIIVRTAYQAPAGQSEGEVAKQLFPDQPAFKEDENRRWELTANHWDLPIHLVNIDAAE